LAGQTLAKAETVALELDHVTVVGEAVEQCADQSGILEDVGPIGKGEVGGQQEGTSQVALADEPEQHLGALLGKRDKTEFIQDDQILFHELFFQTAELVSLRRFAYRRRFAYGRGGGSDYGASEPG
jgi:hypothetical protein